MTPSTTTIDKSSAWTTNSIHYKKGKGSPKASNIHCDAPTKADRKLLIGIDVGATKIAACAGFSTGTVIAQEKQLTVRGRPEELIYQLVATINRLLRQALSQGFDYFDARVGIGICGGVNAEGQVRSPVALAWPEPVPLAKILAERTGLPVAVDNDVNAGALGELRWGKGQNLRNFVYISLGTGIGAGLVFNRQLYRGSNQLAGELGHMSIDINGPICACGNRGCIEALAGGKALADRLREDIQRGSRIADLELSRQLTTAGISAKDIISAAESGDRYAHEVIEQLGDRLAVVIVNLINLLDPDKIILAGGLLHTNDLVMPSITRALDTWRPLFGSTHGRVVRAGLGVNAGAIGAMAVALADINE